MSRAQNNTSDQAAPLPTVLLLGSGGQVGRELLQELGDGWKVIAPRSASLDLADGEALRQAIREAKPRWILNAAAYTAVDRAESEPALAQAINGNAMEIIGQEARACNAAVVHFSTDYVFDGSSATPRKETDPTGPLGVYGCSKLAGERLLAATGAAHFIFRTSWVYSTHGKNFLLTILKLARERDEVRIVADQVGAPTFARDLARLTLHAMEMSEDLAANGEASLPTAVKQIGGLYHACNSGETSWFGFAEEFMQRAQEQNSSVAYGRLTPITTAEYPTPAKRPADSRLDCAKLLKKLGFQMPSWQQSVAEAVQMLETKQSAFATR